jgi:hypothetical protein
MSASAQRGGTARRSLAAFALPLMLSATLGVASAPHEDAVAGKKWSTPVYDNGQDADSPDGKKW